MSTHSRTILAACLGLAALQAAPASAQNARSFVSGTGNGTACTRAAPCATFQLAHAVTNAGGEINCLDAAEYGGLAITKSIAINCESARAGVTVPGGGFGISIAGAASDIVHISGVDVQTGTNGVGIAVSGNVVGELHLRNVSIRNSVGPGATGVAFNPNNVSQLVIKDSTISNFGDGIGVAPNAPGAANVHLSRVRIENNANGVFANGAGSNIGININMQDSLITGNTSAGVRASSLNGQAGINISIISSQVSGNFGPGLKADQAGSGFASIRVGASMISANASAIAFTGGGHVRSFGNNQVNSNGGGEAFTGTDLLK